MSEYSISTSVLGAMPRREGLQLIASVGFRLIELAGSLDDQAEIGAIADLLKEMDLHAASVHISPAAWDIANADPESREAAIQAGLASLRRAARVGADVVICHPNGPSSSFNAEDYEASLARTRHSLERLAQEARVLDLRLALENIPTRHQPRPGGSMNEIIGLIDGLGSHVGICLDTGHSNANGFSPADDARLAGPLLFALHIQDNDGQGEDQHLVPGQGTIDWPAFLAALQDIGFQGLRTLEVAAAENPRDALVALKTICQKWNQEQG